MLKKKSRTGLSLGYQKSLLLLPRLAKEKVFYRKIIKSKDLWYEKKQQDDLPAESENMTGLLQRLDNF
jgi:hypothetical protein